MTHSWSHVNKFWLFQLDYFSSPLIFDEKEKTFSNKFEIIFSVIICFDKHSVWRGNSFKHIYIKKKLMNQFRNKPCGMCIAHLPVKSTLLKSILRKCTDLIKYLDKSKFRLGKGQWLPNWNVKSMLGSQEKKTYIEFFKLYE